MEKFIFMILGACIGASIALIIDCIRDVKAIKNMADDAIKQINELDAYWQSRYKKACAENKRLFDELIASEEKARRYEAQKEFFNVADVKKAKAEKITFGEF